MNSFAEPRFATALGYMTEQIRQRYIKYAIEQKLLPENAHRMQPVISLDAPEDSTQPIQIWQLYSVLGQDRIVNLVKNFYKKVFADEAWFSSVFATVGGVNHHVNTQAAMWIDVMGGGLAYHGGEFRLSFHHSHNAMALMNDKGAQRWVSLMAETLNDPSVDLTDDPRVRVGINTFLSYFVGKYAEEFDFTDCGVFGKTNPPVKRKINFLNMTSDAIEALPENELKNALIARGVDVAQYRDKSELVGKALRL